MSLPFKDEKELSRLNQRYRSALVAFFYRRTASHADAEDLTQDVFVRLANSGDQDIQNVDAYIFQIAANLLKDRGRRSKTQSTALSNVSLLDHVEAEFRDPSRFLMGKEQLNQITGYLAELPERTRTIFILFRIEGIGQNQLASAYQISTRAVQKHVANALAHILQRLKGEGNR